jgi:trimeric autotransporter adhesin
MFGTASNTYTAPGITSFKSKTEQSGPLEVVTSDDGGNLATDGGYIFGKLNQLNTKVDKATEGVALALAISQPVFLPGQDFAFRAGWGAFEGQHAVGFSGAGVIGRGWFGPGSTAVLDAGIGVGAEYNTVAGKAGITFGFGSTPVIR